LDDGIARGRGFSSRIVRLSCIALAVAHLVGVPARSADVPRLAPLNFSDLPAEQQKMFPRGFYGPGTVLVRTPVANQKYLELLAAIKESPSLSKPLAELAILTVARRLDSQFEWFAHTTPELPAGIDPQVIEAIRTNRRPVFADRNQEAIYRYTLAVLEARGVSDSVYFHAKDVLGERGLIDLTLMIGQYQATQSLLVVYRVPLPPGGRPALPSRPGK